MKQLSPKDEAAIRAIALQMGMDPDQAVASFTGAGGGGATQPGRGGFATPRVPGQPAVQLKPPETKTLGGAIANWTGLTDPNDPNRPTTLLGGIVDAFKAPPTGVEKELEAKAPDINPTAPIGRQAAIDAALKKKPLGAPSSLFGVFSSLFG